MTLYKLGSSRLTHRSEARLVGPGSSLHSPSPAGIDCLFSLIRYLLCDLNAIIIKKSLNFKNA